MARLELSAPQLGEHVWHTFTADETIDGESRAHKARIEEAVARHLPGLDWRRARVLELGAYRHYSGHLLARERGCEYFATDIAAPALRDGRGAFARQGGAPAATLVVADFHDLPFASDCFDVVFVVASVHHTRRPEVVLREMLRVARPGGLVIIGNEPCARALCFHAFVANRAQDLTPFEARLNEAGLLPTLSSPFWGARPEHLFGMVENDRIPPSLYAEALEESADVVERAFAMHGLVGAVEERLLAMDAGSAGLERDVRGFLRSIVEQAAAHYGETEALLGYRLPTECEVHALAANVAPLLRARPDSDDAEWTARMFGAALSAVARKRGTCGERAASPFRREVLVEPDGLVHDRPDAGTAAAGLGAPLLPDIQGTTDARTLAPWFPPEDWQWTREDNGLVTLANLVAHARVEIAPHPAPALLVIRYFAVVTDDVPYRVRVWAGGRVLDDQLVVLQESRLLRGLVPADCAEIIVEIASDHGRVDAPWRIRVGVCQLFAVE